MNETDTFIKWILCITSALLVSGISCTIYLQIANADKLATIKSLATFNNDQIRSINVNVDMLRNKKYVTQEEAIAISQTYAPYMRDQNEIKASLKTLREMIQDIEHKVDKNTVKIEQLLKKD